MTEPTPPPPPPAAPPPATPPPYAPTPPKKKGLSPLAWVGIGCASLILIGLIVAGVGVWWLGKKATDFAHDFEKNPEIAAAEMLVRASPDLELVDSDREAGTLTVRSKESGEVLTFDLEDIQQGKLSVLAEDGEETSVTFSGGEKGLEINAKEGGKTSRLRFGAAADEIPSWVPIYPDTEPSTQFISQTGEGTQGAFSLTTDDSPDDVISWYSDEVEALGMEPQESTFSTPGSRGGLVSGEGDGRQINANVANQGEDTLVTVTFSERP